jgi:hypothetical protein
MKREREEDCWNDEELKGRERGDVIKKGGDKWWDEWVEEVRWNEGRRGEKVGRESKDYRI